MATRTTYNNCADTATNPGTGTFTLLGSVPSSPTLLIAARVANTVLANQDAPDYIAVDSADNTKWEEGYGTFTASGTTLTRTLINSSTGSLINFTGTVNIYLSLNMGGLAVANPMTTTGDMIRAGAGGIPQRIASGTAWTINSSLIDLNGIYTVRDTNIGATLIAATTKPATPQVQYTLVAGDFVGGNATVDPNNYVQDTAFIWDAYGQNTDGVLARTLNFRFCYSTDGGATWTDLGGSDGGGAISASQYWRASPSATSPGILLNATQLVTGNLLGIKLWASVTNAINYIAHTLIGVPRILNSYANTFLQKSQVAGTVTAAGSLSGVTYTAALYGNIATINITVANYDIVLSSFGSPANTAIMPAAIGKFNYLTLAADNVQVGTSSLATATLFSINRSTWQRYFHKVTITS